MKIKFYILLSVIIQNVFIFSTIQYGIFFAVISSMITSETSKKIFVVDSRKQSLKKILAEIGFNSLENIHPETLLEEIKAFKPSLIVGDFYGDIQESLISALRKDLYLGNIPVILCADKKNITRVIRKINGNVNDYLVKPFRTEELNARIERVLTRHEKLLNTNPLSHLPGNISIKAKVSELNDQKKDYAVVYMDVDHFKPFNDYYGYSRGDDVIRFVADLCRKYSQGTENSPSSYFAGHIGGDDFVIIHPRETIHTYCEAFIREFDEKIKDFYNTQDLKRGYIRIQNRKGKIERFPVMSISLAVVCIDALHPLHYGEISLRGSEIKKYLKSFKGSHYLIDRRILKTKAKAA